MATITSIRIPVRNSENVIVERVDPARARRLSRASNATPVYKRNGELVGIQLADIGNDSLERASLSNPKKYTFLETSPLMPEGVHTLRHLPSNTRSLYCTAQTDCLKKAAASQHSVVTVTRKAA